MPLSMVNSGQKVRIMNVLGGRGIQARLAAMGLVPGIQIEVISNSFHSPFIVSVKESRIMLGRGMAHKIMVQ